MHRNVAEPFCLDDVFWMLSVLIAISCVSAEHIHVAHDRLLYMTIIEANCDVKDGKYLFSLRKMYVLKTRLVPGYTRWDAGLAWRSLF
jgi:hypothetical protein